MLASMPPLPTSASDMSSAETAILLWSMLMLLWTSASIIRGIQLLGKKYHKDTLSDKFVLLPLLLIAIIYGTLYTTIKKFKKVMK